MKSQDPKDISNHQYQEDRRGTLSEQQEVVLAGEQDESTQNIVIEQVVPPTLYQGEGVVETPVAADEEAAVQTEQSTTEEEEYIDEFIAEKIAEDGYEEGTNDSDIAALDHNSIDELDVEDGDEPIEEPIGHVNSAELETDEDIDEKEQEVVEMTESIEEVESSSIETEAQAGVEALLVAGEAKTEELANDAMQSDVLAEEDEGEEERELAFESIVVESHEIEPDDSETARHEVDNTGIEKDEVANTKVSPELLKERPWLEHYPQDIRSSLDYPKENIAQFLIDAAVQFPKHLAIQFMGKSYTYEKLYASADSLAKQLGRQGVHKGDRVAIMLPNCPQAVIAYYGVLLAGAIVVQMNPLYVERELKQQLLDCSAVALITLDLLYPRIEKVRGKNFEHGDLPKLKSVIITSIKDGLPFPKNILYPIKQKRNGFTAVIPYGENGYINWKTMFSKKALSYERPPLAGHDEIAAIQYTGGTTGTPKGVMLSHFNLVANTVQTMEWFSRVRIGKERYLAALPLFHVFGLTVLMNMSVRSAGCLILLPKFEVNEVLRTITKSKPTIFPGAPTMYVGIIQAVSKSEKIDLSSIEFCISGSAALPLEVQEQFEQLTGGRLIEGYGLTEASPVTHANPIWGKRKIGTIGIPFPDTEAAIIDPESGERLPSGSLGELVIRGPQVMKGYWNKPEATDLVLKDGWLKTGDLAQMDTDGYFIIMDRMKDIIIAGGYNIYPREIEEVLFEHPAIAEAAVVGVKDSYRGETVKAFIVLKENMAVSDNQLNEWCRARLAAYKVPHLYAFKESLPKTMVGKVLKRQLIEEEQ